MMKPWKYSSVLSVVFVTILMIGLLRSEPVTYAQVQEQESECSSVYEEFSMLEPFLVETEDFYVYVTSFGNYSFRKEMPYLMNFRCRDKTQLIEAGMFWVNTSESLVPLNPEVLVVNNTVFQVTVEVARLLEVMGHLTVTVYFSKDTPPKFEVYLEKSELWDLGNFNIVWALITNGKYCKIAEHETRYFGEHRSLELVSTKFLEVEVGPEEDYGEWRIWSLTLWEDVGYGQLYVGKIEVAEVISATGILIVFEENLDLIDPITVAKSTAVTAVGYTHQVKNFYALGRHWVFFSNGTDLMFSSSTDGSTWDTPTFVKAGITRGIMFSIYWDGTYVNVAIGTATPSEPLIYKRGVAYANGTITWDPEVNAVSASRSAAYYKVTIVKDSNGYPWIGYQKEDRIKYEFYPYVVRATSTDGTTWDPTPDQLSSVDGHWAVIPVPLTLGKVLALYVADGTVIYGKEWDGGAWGPQFTVSASALLTEYHWKAVSRNATDDVFITFCEEVNYDVIFIKRVGGVWSSELTLHTAIGGDYPSPSITIHDSSGNLYVLYFDNEVLYMRKYNAATGIWEAETTPFGTTFGPFTTIYEWYMTSSYRVEDDIVGVAWTRNKVSPYEIRYDFISLLVKTVTFYFHEGTLQLLVNGTHTANGTSTEYNPNIVLNITGVARYKFKFKNHTYDTFSTTDNPFFLTVTQDYTVHTYFRKLYDCDQIGHNNSICGKATKFYSDWTDLNQTEGLSHYLFSTNNTGTWRNGTWTTAWVNQNWTEAVQTLNSTSGITVAFRFYVNSTEGYEYASTICFFSTTSEEIATGFGSGFILGIMIISALGIMGFYSYSKRGR